MKSYCSATVITTNKQLIKKDFVDSFGKICIMLKIADREHFAKPDKRRMSKEGGE